MKFSLITAILVSPLMVLSTSSGYAGETFDRYTYNGDATYKKAGTNDTSTEESPGSGSSAGYLETKDGYKFYHDLDADQVMWSLRGSHASRFSNGFNMQLDGKFRYLNANYIDDSEFGGTVHLAYHVPDSYALGVYGQAGLVDTNLIDDSIVKTGIGVESAVFFEDATLYGRVGYEHAKVYDVEGDSVFLQAGMRYYVTDDVRLDLDARYQEDYTQVTAAGNYRLQSQPVSLFAGYTYENIDTQTLGSYGSSLIFAGLRFHFDSETLRGEERDGVIWSTIN